VPYRLRGTNRLVYALVLKESQGLALLFCRALTQEDANTLVIAAENVEDRVFESVNASQFPIEDNDLFPLANVLAGVAEGIGDAKLQGLLNPEDLF
jgi:hypothetical protein